MLTVSSHGVDENWLSWLCEGRVFSSHILLALPKTWQDIHSRHHDPSGTNSCVKSWQPGWRSASNHCTDTPSGLRHGEGWERTDRPPRSFAVGAVLRTDSG